jgi:hypothetical protein
MTFETAPLKPLSAATVKQIDWVILESIFGTVANQVRRSGPPVPSASEPLTPEERESARRAFVAARQEFDKALIWLRTTIRWAIASIIGAVVVAVVSGVIVQLTPWAGLISIASIGSLFGLLPRAFSLARDQAMLELLPSRYSLALELCATRRDVNALLARFLDETSSLRKAKVA